MCTSAGWAEALVAITAEKECDSGNSEVGNPGDCGKYMAGVAFMIAYLVLSFLIIVNMYIAVILENYSQVGFKSIFYLNISKSTLFSRKITSILPF